MLYICRPRTITSIIDESIYIDAYVFIQYIRMHENGSYSDTFYMFMMTSSNGNIFRVTGHLCGEFTDPGEFPAQRPVTRSFDVFFDLRLNKRLSKQWWGWWFETLSRPLWRQRNVDILHYLVISSFTCSVLTMYLPREYFNYF